MGGSGGEATVTLIFKYVMSRVSKKIEQAP